MEQQDLERLIAGLRTPEAEPSPTLLQELERKLTTGLAPVKPLRPAGQAAAIAAVMFALIVLAGVSALHPLALPILGLGNSILLIGLLAIGAGTLMWSMAGQMAPGSRYSLPPGFLPAVVLGGVAVLFAVVYPGQEAAGFWPPGKQCLAVGLAFGLAAGGAFWAVLRRGAFLSPRLAGATAGLAAGLAGTTVLTIHCPRVEAPHVIFWHLGAAAICALLGLTLFPAPFGKH